MAICSISLKKNAINHILKEKRGDGMGRKGVNLNYVADMPALLACPPYLTSI